jgi:hypothetical protein
MAYFAMQEDGGFQWCGVDFTGPVKLLRAGIAASLD